MGTYSLVLKKRKGFVKLAHETGALLVPVLGVGEPNIIKGTFRWGCIIPKALTPARVNPIKVVFGPPVCVVAGEGLEDTHKRYVEALLALGKEQGVHLDVVE
jgi:2-acylglycerol O-acyltransferase 2